MDFIIRLNDDIINNNIYTRYNNTKRKFEKNTNYILIFFNLQKRKKTLIYTNHRKTKPFKRYFKENKSNASV